MSTDKTSVDRLLEQYGCGPVQFAGSDNGLYERHLLFDNVVALTAAGPPQRFEAVPPSAPPPPPQPRLRPRETYDRRTPNGHSELSQGVLTRRPPGHNV